MKRMMVLCMTLVCLVSWTTTAEPDAPAKPDPESFEKLPEPNLTADMWPASEGKTVTCTAAELQAKANTLKPGEILLVAPGAADAAIEVKVSGTKDAPITVRAEKKHNTKVKAFKLSGDHIVVDGFEITNPGPRTIGIDAGQVHRKTARTGCQMLNNYIHDVGDTGIYVGVGALAKGNLLRRVGRGFMVNSNSLVEGNEVDTLTVSYHNTKPDQPKKVKKTQYSFFAGDNIVFRGNYFHSAPKDMIKKGMGICFFTTWDAWIIGSSKQILFEDNIGFNATHASEPEQMKLFKSSNFTYRNNLFADTCYVGVLPKKIPYLTIENNTFINCGAYPIWFISPLQTKGGVVRNNVIAYVNRAPDVEKYDWKPSESGIRINPAEFDMVIENNMFDGCKNRGYSETDFSAKPVFMDPGKQDFRLKPGSPGHEKGLGISENVVARPIQCEAPDAK